MKQHNLAVLKPSVYYRIIIILGALDVLFELWVIGHKGGIQFDRYNAPFLVSGPYLIAMAGYGLKRKVSFAKLPIEIRMLGIVSTIGLVIFAILLIKYFVYGTN